MITFIDFAQLVGAVLTPAQRVFALVAYDGCQPRDLKGDERELCRQIFGDVEEVSDLARATIVEVAGARSGKTWLNALRLDHLAVTVPLDMLAPGEVASAVIVAPDMRLAKQALRFALGAIESTPELASMLESSSADSFTLRRDDGYLVTIEALPATRGGSAVRGRSLVAALFDEFAFFRDESSAVNDQAVHDAVSPRVVEGGQLLEVSTAWAEAGVLWKCWTEQFGKPQNCLVAHAPTVLMRPNQAKRVAAEYEKNALNAAREFGAEFISTGTGSYFVSVEERVGQYATPLAPDPKYRAVAAGDFAFASDHSWLIVARDEDGLAVVADWLEIKPARNRPLRPSEVVGRFAELLHRHGITSLIADGHYKESIREALTSHGIRFVSADAGVNGKIRSYSAAQALIREGKALLPKLPPLVTALRDTTVKPLPGGGLQISHPRRAGRGHGDSAAACVLALAALAPAIKRHGRPRDRGGVRGGYEMRAATETTSTGAIDRMRVEGGAVVMGPPARTRLTMRGGNGFGGTGGF
jgi:hypothetical protein